MIKESGSTSIRADIHLVENVYTIKLHANQHVVKTDSVANQQQAESTAQSWLDSYVNLNG